MATHRLTKDQKRHIAGMAAVVAIKDLKYLYEIATDYPDWVMQLPAWMFNKSMDWVTHKEIERVYDHLMLGALMVLERRSLEGAITRLEKEDVSYMLSDSQFAAIHKVYRKEWINWFYRSVEKGEAWALFIHSRLTEIEAQ